jgi:hypothetical protein
MSFPPMISHRVSYEKNGFNTIIKIETIEDLNECINLKEIELDPEELRQFENEIIKQRIRAVGCDSFNVTLGEKNLLVKCKKPIRIKPLGPQDIQIFEEEEKPHE